MNISKIYVGSIQCDVKDAVARNSISDLGTAAKKDVPSSGDASNALVVLGSDSRLTNSRPASDVSSWAKASSKPSYTKSEVGLGNVTNDAQVKRTEMGAASGVATLGTDGKVPSSQLPSYVDDVLEYAKLSSFPSTGESGKIYVAQDTNKTYRWSGSAYTEISTSIVVGTTTGTAFDGKSGYDHVNNTSNPHSVTKAQVGLGNVGNFKAVSTAASQGLDSTEQSNARANIGLGSLATKSSLAASDIPTITKSKISDFPSSMPASDVSSWAKAANKPNYTLDEVSDGTNKKWGDKIGKTINTTWANLKSLRDNSQLVPGQWYRIIDYVTTTAQADTQSAGHAFDVIVRADETNKLNENAFAALHSGDTYFANSKLEAWRLQYCIDNDTNRFAWADSTNGKGVIYRMIDEWNNDVPYDFKNIQFVCAKTILTTYYSGNYAFYSGLLRRDLSRDIVINSTTYYAWYGDNSGFGTYGIKNPIYTESDTVNTETIVYDNTGSEYKSCKISKIVSSLEGAYFTFNVPTGEMSIQSSTVYNNSIQPYYNSNKYQLNRIIFVNSNSPDRCYSNTFGCGCYSNTFGAGCFANTFGCDCSSNTFGNSCQRNSFGDSCYSNTFGDMCLANTFGDMCLANTFGKNCFLNFFGNYFRNNTFGDNCSYNTFGRGCNHNTFGNNHYYNTFGNNCNTNAFGNYCESNTFGNSCESNTFLKDYSAYIIIENGNKNITLTSTQTTSNSAYLQNIKICQGVNRSAVRKTISHDTVSDKFQTTYRAKDSQDVYLSAGGYY